jgi:hypothetical protein
MSPNSNQENANTFFPLYRADDPETGGSRLAPLLRFDDPEQPCSFNDAAAIVLSGEAESVGDRDGAVLYDRKRLEHLADFAWIFEGNPKAHYSRDADGKYKAVERGVNLDDVRLHLEGRAPSLLSIPILPDGRCHFGCLDVDRHADADEPVDHVALAKSVTEHVLPLIVCRSKNPKSAHIWLFLKEANGFPAVTVRRLLERYRQVLGLTGEVEVFPKQETLKEGQKGNGLNLPYFGAERHAYGKDGEVLDLPGFITFAQERRAFGQLLARELTDEPPASGYAPTASVEKKHPPMTVKTIRDLHAKNLAGLRAARPGTRNDTLNTTSFFAARAFAAAALDETEQSIKDVIRKAAIASGMGEREIEATGASGWTSGIAEPLKIQKLPFKTLDEYLSDAAESLPFIVEGLIYKRAAHQLMGTIKAGKTTFLLLLIKATLRGEDFLGRKCASTNILYVTEQPRFTFQTQLRDARMNEDQESLLRPPASSLYIIDLKDLGLLGWPARAQLIRDAAEEVDAGLVIIDTFIRIALIDEIASAGEINAAIEMISPLVVTDERGLVLGWHERKMGGTIVEAAQGTAASGGAVDMLIRLQRPSGERFDTRNRRLETLGRIENCFEEPVAIELNQDKTEYRLVGMAKKAKRVEAQQQVIDALPKAEPGWTEAEIIEALGQKAEREGYKAPARSTIRRALDILVEGGLIVRAGEKGEKDGFQGGGCRYFAPDKDPAVSVSRTSSF